MAAFPLDSLVNVQLLQLLEPDARYVVVPHASHIDERQIVIPPEPLQLEAAQRARYRVIPRATNNVSDIRIRGFGDVRPRLHVTQRRRVW